MKKITHHMAFSLLFLSVLTVSVSAGEIQIPSVRAPISNTQNEIPARAGEIAIPALRQSGYAEQLWFSLSGLLPRLF